MQFLYLHRLGILMAFPCLACTNFSGLCRENGCVYVYPCVLAVTLVLYVHILVQVKVTTFVFPRLCMLPCSTRVCQSRNFTDESAFLSITLVVQVAQNVSV